ncbi:MAG: PLP-dependent aminotransferase family protein [Acidimicrobiales bacterium]|jgi:2-aminoadipate transaminase|nr:PLP-dependent aminotransferase family protein [Acidimicrobiales bacterium]
MHSLLSTRARQQTTSAIRDLLEQAQRPGIISLAGGLPDPSLFPTDRLADIAAEVAGDADVLQYGLTAGQMGLREHIVATTTAASSTNEVLVTTGSQQALHLLSSVLIDPGDQVVVGDPDYLGALQAFRGSGAELVPVTIDADGLDVAALSSRITAGLRPTFVYVVPHFHNPTGVTLTDTRLTALLELAEQNGFLVVLDDPYRDLGVAGAADEPAHHANAVHLRSVSKVLAPGLRVGWMIGPEWLLEAVERTKQSADLHTSTISQAIAHAAISADWFPDHLAGLQAATREKRDALIGALVDRLGERLTVNRPGGGMFVWATFADGTDTNELLDAALDHNVAFVPGAAFAVAADARTSLRLSWATATPEQLTEAVGRLHAAHAALVSA